MGSNVASHGNRGGVLLGQYGIFAANTNGNSNTSAMVMPQNPNTPVPANLTTVGTPGAPIANGNYNGQGISGAFDSGPLLFQVTSGWAKWGVQVRAAVPGVAWTGLSATIYGTFDLDTADGTLTTFNANGIRTSGNENWFVMPAPSDQGGGGTSTNPLILTGSMFQANFPVVAIRIVVAISTGAVLFPIYVVP